LAGFEIFILTKERRDIELFNGRFDDENEKCSQKTFIDALIQMMFSCVGLKKWCKLCKRLFN
jgi:hypothetical protein